MAKKQTKRTRRRRAARAPAPQNTLGLISAAQQICSYTNPFCDAAKGAKWPDGAAIRSVALDAVGAVNFATNSEGHLSVLCISDAYPYYGVGTINSGTNGGVVSFDDLSTFPGTETDSPVRYRITSMGYKISCTSTRMNTKGMLRLRLYSVQDPASLALMETSTPYADQVLDIPLSRLIEKDVYVNIGAVGIDARIFRKTIGAVSTDLAGLIAAGDLLEWQVLTVSVLGGEISTNCLEISCYQHYEKVYTDGDTRMRFSTPAKKASQGFVDTAINTARSVGGYIEGAAKTIDNVYHSKAMQLLLNSVPMTRGPNRAIMAARQSVPLLVD